MTMRRGGLLRNPITFICIVVSISCVIVLFVTVLRLPDIPMRGSRTSNPFKPGKMKSLLRDNGNIGKLGEMVIQMLPEDLAFTLFLPSEKAFERDLRLNAKDGLIGEKANDTYAILTRILGFSAVPRTITSDSVNGEEISYESLSAFRLHMIKDLDERLVVNRVKSIEVDLKKGKVVVHVMDGVIMDAEFEQSVKLDEDDEG